MERLEKLLAIAKFCHDSGFYEEERSILGRAIANCTITGSPERRQAQLLLIDSYEAEGGFAHSIAILQSLYSEIQSPKEKAEIAKQISAWYARECQMLFEQHEKEQEGE